MKHLILSAGHNPDKRGASWEGQSEYDHTSKWVDYIAERIRVLGYPVTKIATGGLTKKVHEVNTWVTSTSMSNIAVELHFNSAGKTYIEGNETLYYPGSVNGMALAESFNSAFVERAMPYIERDRGVKEGWYRMDRPGVIDFYGDEDGDEMPDYFLRKTRCPALILEPLFMCQVVKIGGNWTNVAESVALSLIDIIQ